MRLPWFFGAQPSRRRSDRKRQRSTPALRVRQLERRRVLDAAAGGLVVGSVVETGQELTVTTSVTTNDLMVFNWTPAANSESASAINAFASGVSGGGQGVANTKPAVIAADDQTVNEGQLLDLSGLDGALPLGLILDPDVADTHAAAVNWGDAPLTQFDPVTVFADGGFGKPLGATHTYADGNAVYTVTVRVADGSMSGDFVNGVDGVDFVEDTFMVTVNNVAPTLTISGPANVDEGSLYTLSLASSDPGDDAITSWDIDWGDGNVETVLGNPASATHPYADGNANYVITATATDEDGTFASNSVNVTVDNVAPTITAVNLSDTTIDEGQSLTVSGTFTDPALGAASETFTVVIDWGNGATSVAMVDNTLGTYTATYVYADDHPTTGTASDVFSITVTVTDDGGSDTTVGDAMLARSVTVENVAPTITAVNLSAAMLNEGQSLTVSGTFTDPALGVATESFSVFVDWGNGTTSVAVVDAALGTYTATYLYRDDDPLTGTPQDTISIVVSITDDDGGAFSSASDPGLDRAVTIKNVAPTIALDAVPAISENGTATLTGSYTDVGVHDAQRIVINWNDPNDAQPSTFAFPATVDKIGFPILSVGQTFNSATDEAVLTITAVNPLTGQVSFSVQHRYLDDGLAPGNGTPTDTRSIAATVTDDDTGSNSDKTPITVNNAAPTVTVGSVAAINENGTATVTGSYTDIGLLDRHVLTVNWGDANDAQVSTFAINAIRDAAGAPTLSMDQMFASSTDEAVLTITEINAATGQVSFSVQHQYLDDGLAPGNNTASDISTITVTVADDDTASNMMSTSVLVNNVAPTVALGAVSAINENGTATVTGSYTDIGLLDRHVLTVNWGDANDAQVSTFAINAIRDAAGAPTLSMDQMFASSTDEAVLTITEINAATGQVSFSVQHQYLDDGLAPGNNTASDISTITVTVADDDTASNMMSTSVLVNNVAPTVALGAVSAINENGTATVTGSYTDIGLLDRHVLTVNWGDANDAQVSTFAINAIRDAAGAPTLSMDQMFASSTDEAVLTITEINAATGQVSFSVQHQYLDDGLAPGNNTASDISTITVTVADDDTASNMMSTSVLVNNVLPVLTVGPNLTVNEGQFLDFPGSGGEPSVASFTDVGTLDLHAAQINWGDGHVEVGMVMESAGSGLILGSHTYADDGVYTVTVRLADDDMPAFAAPGNFNSGMPNVDFVQATFTVTVLNVAPSLTDGGPPNVVDEGETFVLSNLPGNTVGNLGIGLSDPGFDNPMNPTTPPPPGEPFLEVFTGYTIDWGDGTADTPVTIVMRNSGTPGTATTALFQHDAHTYADNGVYSVRIRLADDNMSAFGDATRFVTGTEGVDFVDLEFTITVENVNPELGLPTTSVTTITENGSVNFSIGFMDDGFDNPFNDNTPPNGGEMAETFTYDIDWGDNRQTLGNVAVAATPGGINDPSAGSFGGNHIYADDGTYTVTITIHDDDGGSFVRTFNVVVQNVAPQFVPLPNGDSFQGDDIDSNGLTTIRVLYEDIGFDNPANPNAPVLPSISNPLHESFTHVLNWGDGSIDAMHTYVNDGSYTVTITVTGASLNDTFTFDNFAGSNTSLLTLVSGQTLNVPGASPHTYTIDWGDGTIQTVTLSVNQPLAPLAVAERTTVVAANRVNGDEGIATTGAFEIQHTYTGPPNPANPAADIGITVMVMDDNNGFVDDTVFVPNPGIETINVAIDTTPQVPRLEPFIPPMIQPLLDQVTAALQTLQTADAGAGGGDAGVSSERFLELVAYSPDGKEIGRYRLKEEALADLRGLFKTLPDGRYKIFLVRTDNNTQRLVMDVYVRSGRVIDPSDDSEGTRDRPPTSEVEQQNQAAPLEANPFIDQPDGDTENPDAAAAPAVNSVGEITLPEAAAMSGDVAPTIHSTSYNSLRWGASLAGVALTAGGTRWSRKVNAALERADRRAWQRLRRAGGLGRPKSHATDDETRIAATQD